ncbi:MAG: diguanylate cyclase [Treponemataceae bacterium]
MLKILHLDRSALFRKVIRELVARCGHAAESVSTRAEASAALAAGDIDLIVTGLELDDGSGEDFIRDLNASPLKDTPVIVVTSTDSIEMRERLFALGVVDYMLKGELNEDSLRRYFDALAAEDELSRFMRSLRVAVIDDSAVILKIVAGILSLHGFSSVKFFADPAVLFEAEEAFDLYICDIVLPGMSGEQVVTRIRRSGSDAIILCISRFTSEKPLSNILLAGANDYISKPFDAAGLISRLKINVRSYQLKKRLEHLAVTDGLTGLYNHRYSYERVEEEMSKARRYDRPLSAIMIDIDDFKKINDTRGHRIGDEVLKGVAEAIKSALRSVDIVGRYGGEEFIAILPETPHPASCVAAEKIRSAIAEAFFADGTVRATVSLGVAELEPDETLASFIGRSDALLYQAKKAGKNRVES